MNPIKRLKLLQRIVRRKIRFQYQVCIILIKGNEPVKLYSFLVFYWWIIYVTRKAFNGYNYEWKNICMCIYNILHQLHYYYRHTKYNLFGLSLPNMLKIHSIEGHFINTKPFDRVVFTFVGQTGNFKYQLLSFFFYTEHEKWIFVAGIIFVLFPLLPVLCVFFSICVDLIQGD